MDDDCLKLTTYLAERRRTGGRFVSDVLLGLYAQHRIACGVLLRGVGGFGTGHHLRTDESLTLSEDPPVAIIAVDTRTKIEALLDPVLAVKQRGLVTLERARLLHESIGGSQRAEDVGDAVKLTIYVGRKQRVNGSPAYIALCDLMHRRGLSGATVLLGVDGVAHGERQRANFFGRNADVPMMIIAVGESHRITAVPGELSAMLPRPLMTLERLRVLKRDGRRLANPVPPPQGGTEGTTVWQKQRAPPACAGSGATTAITLPTATRSGSCAGACRSSP
jgi:PII-like signaling protein